MNLNLLRNIGKKSMRKTPVIKLTDWNKDSEKIIKRTFLHVAETYVPKGYIIRDKKMITELLKYFTGNESEHDLTKGIYLNGIYGCGKTMLFKVIQKTIAELWPFNQNGFQITSLEKIIETYKKENRLDKFGYRAEIGPGHLCINEFGKTVQEKIYGTEADAIIESLFMTRYEIFQSGKLTHVTSNYSPSQLNYEPIIKDRISEMFNFIEIKGDSFR